MITIEEFASKIRESDEIVFFTGAGISTESGVPDFRSPGGIWTRYTPITFSEFLSSEEARIRAWKRRKESHERYRNAEPNVGHYFIRGLEKRGKLLGLITQNVDGLHSRAGVPDDKIVELHGTNRKVVCLRCGKFFGMDEILEGLVGDFAAPVCDDCGGILKSATVAFGEPMPADAMRRAQALSEAARVFVVVGSSLQVQPAASFPVIAKQQGAFVSIINRDATPLDSLADYVYRGEIRDFCRQLNALVADS